MQVAFNFSHNVKFYYYKMLLIVLIFPLQQTQILCILVCIFYNCNFLISKYLKQYLGNLYR